MRAIIVALIIAGVFADDRTFCEKKCAEKYTEGDLKNACNAGCGARPDISAGPFAMVKCYRSCDNNFTQGNGTEYESEAHAACSYACSLPMSRSLFMSVKYSNDEKPVIEIVRKEGDEIVDSTSHMGSPSVDQLISGLLGGMNRIPIIRNPLSTQNSQSEQEHNSSANDYSNTAMFESARGRIMKMHERMNAMLAAFTRQFFEGIRRQMQHQHHVFAERPNGHDFFSHIGPEVDNFLANGEPILITHPLTRDEDNDDTARPIKVFRYQSSSNHPPSIFYWIMIVFGIGALLLTLYASVIFFRVMRSAAYKRISADVANGRSTSLTSPGSLPVKKVPLDGWVDHSEPSGVPPPAYDQVSIHSVQKQQQHHGQEAQPKLDNISSSPTNGRK